LNIKQKTRCELFRFTEAKPCAHYCLRTRRVRIYFFVCGHKKSRIVGGVIVTLP
jgi:hypothetical protein